ncbi:SLBB domain-containing protein [Pleionea sp. CnH1-48]|uniref:SLBB domain-containing protein n=1 Tax=Pleionea sp. CnH1-48 TaxID=2954494 RepID=UPI002096C1FF|nr:SLBB domain-containing protein [Pleionea sp. CnH1-48]MCO7223810.1 SLBB domain-containing protein [Pleionea sp. CnH1-48]
MLGRLFFLFSVIFSFAGLEAAELDINKLKQQCAKATAQQKQAAKAVGYDLDELCSGLESLTSKDKDSLKEPELIKRRPARSRKTDIFENDKEPLDKKEINSDPKEELEKTKEKYVDKLKPFGYELFEGVPTTFAPVTNIPVPANYVIGPGDTINIQLFGKSSSSYQLLVDRSGNIQFPELGPISVAGLEYEQLKQLLLKRVREQMIGVNADINLGELRSMQIFVLGEAYRPGAYTVSSLSTITNALFVSGGIKEIGSLRNIHLKRQGQTVATLDLYDLLLKGDTSADTRLLPGDVIYIEPVGTTVSISGAIRRPAIYELADEDRLEDVIALAGGAKPEAFLPETNITRITKSGFITSLVANMSIEEGKNFKVRDGDKITLEETIDDLKNVVTLSGHVHRPKSIAWKKGLRISNLVRSLHELKPFAQLNSAILVRQSFPSQELSIELVNIEKALQFPQDEYDLVLENQDKLLVLSFDEDDRNEKLENLKEQLEKQASLDSVSKVVSISGQVKFPGAYPLANDMSLEDLIELSGGLTESAYTLGGEITRLQQHPSQSVSVEHISLSFDGQRTSDISLQSWDSINIWQKPDYRQFATVEVKGEVLFPGEYRIKRGETLKQLMKRVGGFSEYAHVDAVVFTREELKEREEKQLQDLRAKLKSDIANTQLEKQNIGQSANVGSLEKLFESLENTEALGRLVIDMKAILSSKSQDVTLKDGDKIVIPAFRQEVSVVGEVQHPASHLFDPYLSFEDYIERSGGETEKADDSRIYIVKADGSVVLPNKSGWISAQGVSIEPGDTIVVPLDVDSVDSLSLWTQVSQVIYQLALGAAAVKSL